MSWDKAYGMSTEDPKYAKRDELDYILQTNLCDAGTPKYVPMREYEKAKAQLSNCDKALVSAGCNYDAIIYQARKNMTSQPTIDEHGTLSPDMEKVILEQNRNMTPTEHSLTPEEKTSAYRYMKIPDLSPEETRMIDTHRARKALTAKPADPIRPVRHAQCTIVELVKFGQAADPKNSTWTHLLDMLKANRWTE